MDIEVGPPSPEALDEAPGERPAVRGPRMEHVEVFVVGGQVVGTR
ncbi:hypothetical protein KPATCC21470_0381 [Kitasatospora purpeofusca]